MLFGLLRHDSNDNRDTEKDLATVLIPEKKEHERTTTSASSCVCSYQQSISIHPTEQHFIGVLLQGQSTLTAQQVG